MFLQMALFHSFYGWVVFHWSNQSILKISPGISLEGNYAKAETPVLCPLHAKSWLIGKDSDAGRDWGQEEKGTTEDEMAGWHHWLNGRVSEWTPGVGDGQGGLACCDSWGHRELDTTEWLNWTELNVNVSMLLSQFIWPSPSSAASKVCSLSMSLFLPCKLYIFLNSRYMS